MEVAPAAPLTAAVAVGPIAAPTTVLLPPAAVTALPAPATFAAVPGATLVAAAPAQEAPAAQELVAQAGSGFVPVRSPASARRGTIAALEHGGKLPADSGSGLALFDGGALRGDSVFGASVADERTRLSPAPAAPTAKAAAAAVPLGRRIREAKEVGSHAAGWELLTGILFLALGSKVFFPALAGVVWGWGGALMLEALAKSRAVIVGGWQASHDQKMRTDYATGKLIDIRGRAYGEDRYDEWAPGAVSPRERGVIDAAALALGLPWAWSWGPKGVALYGASALAVVAFRNWRSRRHPAPAPPSNTDFEYDR